MARRRQPVFSWWRKAAIEDETLTPLLGSVAPVAPPEGLLRRIELSVDAPEPSDAVAPRRGRTIWLGVIAGASTICAAALFLTTTLGAPDAYLRDGTGRSVANVHVYGDLTSISLVGGDTGLDQEMVWHLWGLQTASSTPVSLGNLSDDPIYFETHLSLTGYAMSLEKRGFSGSAPEGIIIPLTRDP